MRKWKRELNFIGANAGILGGAAFLCAMGCVLLWVSGGSGWYLFKMTGRDAPSVVFLFVLSLLVSGICGLCGGMIFLWGRSACPLRPVLPPLFLTAASYLLHLSWYAVFLCTRLSLFGGILAVLAVLAAICALILMRRSLFVYRVAAVLLVLAESYFIYVTFLLIL